MNTNDICEHILTRFQIDGNIISCAPYGNGHINNTYCIETGKHGGAREKYILQRINTNIFPDPRSLMENIHGITAYLSAKILEKGGDPLRETLTIVPTDGNEDFYQDDRGAWRVYKFIEGSLCLQQAESDNDFYESAKAFGSFFSDLQDYPTETLHETIPDFHNTLKRYERFEKAVKNDPFGRASLISSEISFAQKRYETCTHLSNLMYSGVLPLRVTHNDTKLNNVLFDENSRTALCVIDLDTVMPGLIAYDFGDAIRFGANHCAEDETDLDKVNYDLHLFEVYSQGLLEAAGDAISKDEVLSLPWGARIMTYENGIRFLTDFLEGDHYFKTTREHQNLDRARTQFKLLTEMEKQMDEMLRIVQLS